MNDLGAHVLGQSVEVDRGRELGANGRHSWTMIAHGPISAATEDRCAERGFRYIRDMTSQPPLTRLIETTPSNSMVERAARIAAMLERWNSDDVSTEPAWNVEDLEPMTAGRNVVLEIPARAGR